MKSNQRNEQAAADRTVEALQSSTNKPVSPADSAAFELGRILRELPASECVEPNLELRSQLLAHVEEQSDKATASIDEGLSVSNTARTWKPAWVLAATLLIVGLLGWGLLPGVQQVREAARRTSGSRLADRAGSPAMEYSAKETLAQDDFAFYEQAAKNTSGEKHFEGDYGITKREAVLGRLGLSPGDKIDANVIRKGERRLKSSEIFSGRKLSGEGQNVVGRPPKIVVRPPSLGGTGGGQGRTDDGIGLPNPDGWLSRKMKRRTSDSLDLIDASDITHDAYLKKLKPNDNSRRQLSVHNSEGFEDMGMDMEMDMVMKMGMGGQTPQRIARTKLAAINQAKQDLAYTRDLLTQAQRNAVELDPTETLEGEAGDRTRSGDSDEYIKLLKDGKNQFENRYLAQRDHLETLLKQSEASGGEQYTPIQENPFVAAVSGDAISTFSIDVDTASYANMRRYLTGGQLPPPDSVRLEELINYFDYDYDQPKDDKPFSVDLELAACPWNEGHQLLRVGLQGKDMHVNERPATNVVFLIDVSGSMQDQNKLPLLKRGFQMMAEQLNENDRVSIVTYAGNAGVALEPTNGAATKTINEAIERLTSGGSTHGSAGIQLAYELAQQNFIKDGVNKVILATDGDLNVGVTSDDALVTLIKQKASEDVFLTVLGFGTGNLQDGKLEKLADNGNGLYAYIDSLREAHKVLVQQLSGSLVTIAKDVKIQIEFNPAEVKSYRLLGYENRLLATEDFDNDQKDAGEIGAGHSVTAIYEIVTTNHAENAATAIPKGLKYQTAGAAAAAVKLEEKTKADKNRLTAAAKSGELATVALRYKQPTAKESQRIEFTIANTPQSFSAASDDFRFATSVAGFGMLLRGSEYSGPVTLTQIEEIASGSMGRDMSGYRAEFVDLVRSAGKVKR